MQLKNIYQHLDLIKLRPGMFIGNRDVQNLFLYCSGYLGCIKFNELKIKEDPNFFFFHDYIAVILGYKESTSGWANMLDDYYKDKEIAFNKFFEHLENFKNDIKGKTEEDIRIFLKSKGYELNFNFLK